MNSLRRAASGWTAKLLLGLLVVSFAVWGIGDVFRSGASNAVLSVGETSVPLQEYALAYNQVRRSIAQQIGRVPTREETEMFGVDQGVLSQLLSGAVLTEQGREIGLGLSKERLARLIADDPSFRDAAGNFSRAQFRNALASVGLNEANYIESQQEAATRTQIVDAVSNGVTLPTAFRDAMGLYNGERRNISYVVVGPDSVGPIADPSEETLTAYFDENKETYAAPEYRSFQVAELTPETMADEASVTEDAIKADYERFQSRYGTPERRRVDQIVFPDQAAADAAAEKLANGASFEEIAQEAGRNPADLSLGLVTRDGLPDPALADAAFSLESGATSGVVDGRFGPTILRVDEIQPASVQPLEEVAPQIRRDLAIANAADTLNSAYDAYEDARAGGATFQEAAERAGIPVKTYEGVDAQGRGKDGERIADLPDSSELLGEVFQVEPGFDNAPLQTAGNGTLFFDVTEIEPARDRTLDEVRDRVLADWRAAETERLVTERAKAVFDAARSGTPFEDVAAQNNLTVQTALGITRQSGASEIGGPATEAAFSAGRGAIEEAEGRESGSRMVLRIDEVAPPASPADNVSDSQRQQMAERLTDDLLQSYVTRVRGEYPVQVYPAGIEAAKGLVR